jgi:hypothetical protein
LRVFVTANAIDPVDQQVGNVVPIDHDLRLPIRHRRERRRGRSCGGLWVPWVALGCSTSSL